MIWKSGLCLLMVITVLVQGQPQYEVQVQLPIRFVGYTSGHTHQLANGSCCSLNETAPNCTTPCSEIQITLCFREASHSLTDTDITNCPLGMITVTNNEPGDYINLNATSNATTTTYPGSFNFVYEIIASEGIIDQESLMQSQLIQNGSRFVRLRRERTIISIDMLGVVCKEGYFGPDCGCTPQDDSTGHFTCDEDGTIVCLPGYQNTATNCVEEEGITPEPTTDPETISETPTNTQTTNFPSKNTIESSMQTVQKSNTVFPIETTFIGSNDRSNILFQIEPTFTSSNDITVSMTGTSDGTTTATTGVLPIAVGGAVGGLVVLLIIIISVILFIWIIKRKKKNKKSGDEITTTMISLEGLPNSNNNTGGSDSAEVYAMVNKESKQEEEAPPVTPYKGEIYSEVEATGLFPTKTGASNTVTPGEEEEPRYNTTQFASRAVHSSKEQLSEEPHYDTTFTKTTPSEEEPHYDTTAKKVPNSATAQIGSETNYNVLNGESKSSAQNIGSEYSTLGATTHYQNQAELQATQDERQYSELKTTKKPNDQTDDETAYSLIENENTTHAYSQVEYETTSPEIAYAELDIHNGKNTATRKSEDNIEIQYSHIQNAQSP